MSEARVSVASDYVVMEAGGFYFYYGYEHVWCNDHRSFADSCGEDCATEWAFTVKQNGEYIDKYRRSTEIDEFNVEQQMIHGLGLFILEEAEQT